MDTQKAFKSFLTTVIFLLITSFGYSQDTFTITDPNDLPVGTNLFTPCSGTGAETNLRRALFCARAGDIINVDVANITLNAEVAGDFSTGQLSIDDDSFTLNGNGVTIDANGNTGISIGGFAGAPAGRPLTGLTINDLTITNANVGIQVLGDYPDANGNEDIVLNDIAVSNTVGNGIFVQGAETENVTISDFTGTNIGQNGIQVSGAPSPLITNPIITGTGADPGAGTAIHGIFAQNLTGLEITGGNITQADGSGLRFSQVVGGTIDGVISNQNDQDGLNIDGSEDLIINNSNFNQNGVVPVPFDAVAGTGGEGRGAFIGGSTNITITNSTFNMNAFSGAQLSDTENSTIDQTEFNQNGTEANGDFHGLSLSGSTGNEITRSTFNENFRNGIEFNQNDAGISSDNNIIGGAVGSGNTFDNNGRIGIALQGGASDLTVTFNEVRNHTTDAGIQLNTTDDPMSTINISDNVVQSNEIGIQVLDGNVVTDITISNNKIGADALGNTGVGLGNTSDGIQILSPLSGIILTENIVINSGDNGINISSMSPPVGGSTLNIIQGNLVGFDASFNSAPNGASGINLDEQTQQVQLGGTGVGEGNFVAGNLGNGITIGGSATSTVEDIFLLGNTIGATSDTPFDTLGNQGNGIFIDFAENVVVGGIADSANVIVANGNSGVFIGGNGIVNQLRGNFIGTSSTGMDSFGNQEYGIQIEGGDQHVIGGTAPGQGNLIAANNGLGGVLINGGTDTEVLGNFIGIQDNLSDTISSVGDGITVTAGNHFIGVTAGGVIAGNSIAGHDIAINLTGGSSVVDGNLIGIDNGTDTFGNGIGIVVGSNGNIIGQAGNGNSIIVSEENGINVTGSNNSISDNIIQNNGVGGVIGNGISLTAGTTNSITDNIIGGNTERAIFINASDDITITGNDFGRDENGNTAPHDTEDILIQSGNGITIGDDRTANPNIFSGTVDNHINISGGTNISIDGNFFGVDETQATLDQTTGSAIQVFGTASNVNIGGAGTEGNVISTGSTTDAAVIISGDVTDVDVSGNYIGVTEVSNGTAIAGNTIATAIEVNGNASANIGTTAGNNIGITSSNAIHINNGTGTVVVENNNIGTDDSGDNTDADLDIGGHGVFVNNTDGVTVNDNNISNVNTAGDFGIFISNSDDGTFDGNTVFENIDNGVQVSGSNGNTISNNIITQNLNGIGLDNSDGNIVLSNAIGTSGIATTDDLGNSEAGISIINESSGNTIDGNTVAFNDIAIIVDGTASAATNENTVLQGSYFCNDQGDTGGIQLLDGGNNDFLSASGGGTFSVDTAFALIDTTGGSTNFEFPGTLTPGSRVQIYSIGASPEFTDPECLTCRQGRTFVNEIVVPGTGLAEIDLGNSFGTGDDVCTMFTFTITDTDGNTSEFSDCSTCICAAPPAQYDVYEDTIRLCVVENSPTLTIDTLSAGITGTGPFIFEWFRDNGDGTATSVSGNNLTFTPPTQTTFDTTTYFFTIGFSNQPCVNQSLLTSIVTFGVPTLEPLTEDTLCEGEMLDFTSQIVVTNEMSLTWDSPDVDPLTNVYTPNITDLGTIVTLSLTANAFHTCDDSTVMVDIFLPEDPTVDAGNTLTECAGTTIETSRLTPTASGDFELLTWSSAFGSFTDDDELTTAEYNPGNIIADSTVRLFLMADGIGGCPDAIDSVDIDLVVSPLGDAGSDTTICINESIDLSTLDISPSASGNVSQMWTVLSGGSGTFVTDTDLQPTFTPDVGTTGNLVLNLEVAGATPGTCQFQNDQITITVNPLPDVTFNTINPICEGETVDLSTVTTVDLTTITSLEWMSSETDGMFSSLTTVTSVYTHGVNAGTIDPIITLDIEPLPGCMFTDPTQTFDVQVEPELTAGMDSVICITDDYLITDFTVTGADQFDWTSDNGLGTFNPANTLASTYEPVLADATTGTINLTLTASLSTNNVACRDTSATVVLTVNPTPVIDFPQVDDICQGDSVDLSSATINVNTVDSFQWSSNEGIDGTFTPNDMTQGGAIAYFHGPNATVTPPIITLTATALEGCMDTTATRTFVVSPAPVITIGMGGSICELDPFTVTGTSVINAPDGVVWMTNGASIASFNDNTIENPIYTPLAADIGDTLELLLIATNNASPVECSVDSAIIELIVNEQPFVDAGLDKEVCVGLDVQLDLAVTSSTVTTLSWTVPMGDGTITPINSTQPTYSSVETDAGMLVIVQVETNANGACMADFDSVNVTVHDLPVVNATSDEADSTVCELDEIILTGTGDPIVGVYMWNAGVTDGLAFEPITRTYTVTGTDANGCVNTDDIEITVNPNEDLSASINQPPAECEGEDLTFLLTSEEPAMTTRQWFVNGIQEAGETGTSLTDGFTQDDEITVVLTSTSECVTGVGVTGIPGDWELISNISVANFTPRPDGMITGNTLYCFDEPINLTFEPINSTILPGIDPFVWTRIPDGTTSTGNSADVSNPGVGEFTYTVMVANSTSCFSIFTENIEIRQVEVNISSSADNIGNRITEGDEITLTANGTNNPNDSDINYVWNTGENTRVITDIPADDFTYIVTASDVDLPTCQDVDQLFVQVRGVPTAFNVFTPPLSGNEEDGDGANDTWRIRDIEGFDQAQIKVFNRWGNVVFEYDNSNDDYNDNAWDGTRNGNPVPVATYYYVVELNDDTLPEDRRTLQGFVAIIR